MPSQKDRLQSILSQLNSRPGGKQTNIASGKRLRPILKALQGTGLNPAKDSFGGKSSPSKSHTSRAGGTVTRSVDPNNPLAGAQLKSPSTTDATTGMGMPALSVNVSGLSSLAQDPSSNVAGRNPTQLSKQVLNRRKKRQKADV